jgi:hypothetical protein
VWNIRGVADFVIILDKAAVSQELSLVDGPVGSCQRIEPLEYLSRRIFMPNTINRNNS